MSTPTVRRLLANLLSAEDGPRRYLEIGIFAGSTLFPAVISHPEVVAAAVDDYSWPGDESSQEARSSFLAQRKRLDMTERVRFVEKDCFQATAEELDFAPFHVLFYDGDHSEESQRRAVCDLQIHMAPVYVMVVDDHSQSDVRQGTERGLIDGGQNVLFSEELAGPEWWEGLRVMVLERRMPRTED